MGLPWGPNLPFGLAQECLGCLLLQKVKPEALMSSFGSSHHLSGDSKTRELSMALQEVV